ncbi:MAG: hypothetical protein WC683_15615 [bacterium]
MSAIAKVRGGISGQVASEFVLMLPISAGIIITVLGMALSGVRGVVAQASAMRGARVAAVFQDDFVDDELYASLDPAIFGSNSFQITAEAGGMRTSNELEGIFELHASPNAALTSGPMNTSWFMRASPVTPALPEGLHDAQLRGGDTPSPYCRSDGGYEACGWPE